VSKTCTGEEHKRNHESGGKSHDSVGWVERSEAHAVGP
jgi:hypothetical protein